MSELAWDTRLNQRGVTLDRFSPAPGQKVWRLISARYMDPAESAGRHNIFVETLDEHGYRQVGAPVTLINGGHTLHPSEAKPNDSYGSAPAMYNSGAAYSIRVGADSDTVHGMGLGTVENPNGKDHVSYFLVFQRTAEDTGGPTPPQKPSDWLQVMEMAYDLVALAKKNLPRVGLSVGV